MSPILKRFLIGIPIMAALVLLISPLQDRWPLLNSHYVRDIVFAGLGVLTSLLLERIFPKRTISERGTHD